GGEAATSSVPPLAPPRPLSPWRLRVSNGQVVALDRTVVIGRRPRSTRVSGTDLPHLVAVDSPQQDISRSHVEVRVEGDSIVATDLRTTNGTTLRRAGSDPVRLHPGEGTVVVPGDVLDLGDGITVAVEEMS
ncbi:FHA domain-containing protein, partial [Microbacterium sp. CPCC 204701]|uniref:FHA domain-containing protein n=1 Tax=Microbacterium sp. CPCC 204701 TaxID=2493084 RepID=UPI0013E3D0C5